MSTPSKIPQPRKKAKRTEPLVESSPEVVHLSPQRSKALREAHLLGYISESRRRQLMFENTRVPGDARRASAMPLTAHERSQADAEMAAANAILQNLVQQGIISPSSASKAAAEREMLEDELRNRPSLEEEVFGASRAKVARGGDFRYSYEFTSPDERKENYPASFLADPPPPGLNYKHHTPIPGRSMSSVVPATPLSPSRSTQDLLMSLAGTPPPRTQPVLAPVQRLSLSPYSMSQAFPEFMRRAYNGGSYAWKRFSNGLYRWRKRYARRRSYREAARDTKGLDNIVRNARKRYAKRSQELFWNSDSHAERRADPGYRKHVALIQRSWHHSPVAPPLVPPPTPQIRNFTEEFRWHRARTDPKFRFRLHI